MEYIEETKAPYDGLILDKCGVPLGDEIRDRGLSCVNLRTDQVMGSASHFALIPLSLSGKTVGKQNSSYAHRVEPIGLTFQPHQSIL